MSYSISDNALKRKIKSALRWERGERYEGTAAWEMRVLLRELSHFFGRKLPWVQKRASAGGLLHPGLCVGAGASFLRSLSGISL